jgi:hypothetical protein
MKCLEKDRTRRYETANGLAMDIHRHLANEPVTACPPSAAYRFRKLVHRNKLAVASVVAVAAALVLGLGVSTWLWLQARASEAEMRKMLKFFTDTQINRTATPREFPTVSARSGGENPYVVQSANDPRLLGKTREQWAAALWKWSLEFPPTNSLGAVHPWIQSDRFDIAALQSGDVWFLGAPFGTTRRTGRIPYGKSLFFPLFSVEVSDLEPPPFYALIDDQAVKARYWADHIVDTFCEIDGVKLQNIEAYRILTGPFPFSAPSPWIQGERGGPGTASGDGYFVFLAPMPPGEHTIHLGGKVHFTKDRDPIEFNGAIDTTYTLTVTPK